MTFWIEMIEKYLKPLDKDVEKEKRAAQGLLELRNQAVFSFLMLNSIWVVLLFLMQENKNTLSVKWPWPKNTNNVTWDQGDNTGTYRFEKQSGRLTATAYFATNSN